MRLHNKIIITFIALLCLFLATSAYASRTEITARATIISFGTYSFEGILAGIIREPGVTELGEITVKGTYNGPYPWVMRIYTDNKNFIGTGEAFGLPSPAGLVSIDGRYTLPLEASCLNWGEEVWLRIPDVNEEDYVEYYPPNEVDAGTHTERIIMAIDPRNADWVSGSDHVLFTGDDLILGDILLETPFDIRLRTDVDPCAPVGDYEGKIYIEILPTP